MVPVEAGSDFFRNMLRRDPVTDEVMKPVTIPVPLELGGHYGHLPKTNGYGVSQSERMSQHYMFLQCHQIF